MVGDRAWLVFVMALDLTAHKMAPRRAIFMSARALVISLVSPFAPWSPLTVSSILEVVV